MMTRIDYTLVEIEQARRTFLAARVAELLADCEMTRQEAEAEAMDEWGPTLRAKAPDCWSCEFIGPEMHDPYGTGDSPTMRECTVQECPWGKR